jgi:hypothetical protein
LTPEYYHGLEREVLQECITNEIAWLVAWVHELGFDSPAGAGHLGAVGALEGVRGMVQSAGGEGLAITAAMVDVVQAIHHVGDAA